MHFYIAAKSKTKKLSEKTIGKKILAIYKKLIYLLHKTLKNQCEKQAKNMKRLFINLSGVYTTVQNIVAVNNN